MFVKAIETGLSFTKPVVTGKVLYENRKLINELNTLMVINNNGDLLTSNYVADLFLASEDINEVFPSILSEIKNANKRDMIKIENKYGIKKEAVIAIHSILIDIVDRPGKLTIFKHEYLDLAIITIKNKYQLFTNNFPVFKTNNVKIGTSICGLGFTFPEYEAFEYDLDEDKLIITNKIMNFPVFPITGIITRNVADQKNLITMFETNFAVLPGQNGGPILDVNGLVIGMMIGNKNNYIVNTTVNLTLGIAINSATIVKFLDKHKIQYNKLNN